MNLYEKAIKTKRKLTETRVRAFFLFSPGIKDLNPKYAIAQIIKTSEMISKACDKFLTS